MIESYVKFVSQDEMGTKVEMTVLQSYTVVEIVDAFRYFLYALGYNPTQVDEETGKEDE